ncbi:MAG TPA: CBS domain-containing protein [Clostridia bacterium]
MGLNASRFIEAYNTIDRTLRSQYGFKDNISFSELLRQTSSKNQLIKKYEDELYDFGRLRNAIVHKSTDKIIAEPNDETVGLICHIADLLTSPPIVMDVIKVKNVIAFDHEQNLYDLIDDIFKHNYSNIPIYKDKQVIGVVNSKLILNMIVRLLQASDSVSAAALKKIKLGDIATIDSREYLFMSTGASILDVLTAYANNPRLKAILLTKYGDNTAPVVAVITSSDWMTFNNILDKI